MLREIESEVQKHFLHPEAYSQKYNFVFLLLKN